MHADKKWVVRPAGDAAKVETLSTALGIDPKLANLLVQRGIDTTESARRFFDPKLEELHDPYLMKDMMLAVQRIEQAISRRERVMVYGDYDVDGISAVALVYNFLSRWMDDLLFYIPDRYAEGYGISEKGIDYAADNGAKLIIALDCGIKACSRVAYAKRKGVDFIICDHHLPGDAIPEAVAVLDPKREDCTYPCKDLSGCGVGFKLVQAFCQYKELPFETIEPLLDLVAVSIASDIVPIVGENRILAHYGLIRLNRKPNKGLAAIIKLCGLERHTIAIDDIVFKIGPRINAAGRMEIEIDRDDPRAQSGGRTAVRLLTAVDERRALYYVAQIDAFNKDRKSIDRNITLEAHRYLEESPEMLRKKCTVIYNPNWMKGVVGIVASRLIETYYRPTVVLTMSHGLITGSARSVPGFDLYQAVESCADLLENFGGHTYAAGLTMKPERFDEFRSRFEAYVEAHIDPEMLVPQIDIDEPLRFDEITPAFRRTLSAFQPFGPGNPSPVFVTADVSDNGSARLVGARGEHLKMELVQRQHPFNPISAIAFGQIDHFDHVKRGGSIDICYNIVENHYQGSITPQLRIKDIKPGRM
ncbi:single-stranded-DNA-specific exonuclease RecJ [uncultured Rikenella sp.]|uniref:single-stranded-DNA-specific exonuclease RecJ n=1 Tax=uncultured Rikenella sp. TaxID=368003 RepID=UPI0026006FBE|nr:single-stranded-DNA-specific exonuclease RecJ [uncultured Rikenella sp.]